MSSPFKDALREELLTAARRDLATTRRPRRWRRVTAAAAAALAALVGAIVVLTPSPASAGIDVTVEGGRVEVRITDLTTTPNEVRDVLADAGFDARVEGASTGPSQVGRFISVLIEGDTAPITLLGDDGATFDGFAIDADWEGELVIVVGEPAGDDEMYAAGTDAFARGEPLECLDLVGTTLRASQSALRDLQTTVIAEGHPGAPVPLGDPAADQFADWYINDARAQSAHDVLVRVSQDPLVGARGAAC